MSSLSITLVSTGALLFRPLVSLGAMGTSFNLIPIWANAYRSLTKDRRVNVAVIDAVAVSGLLLSGHYLVAAFADWLYYAGLKLTTTLRDRAQEKITHAFGAMPSEAWIIADGMERRVPIETLEAGSRVAVYAGESMPVDGIIVEGCAAIDQRALTGESQPAEKGVGEPVFASTLVLSGRIVVRTLQSGQSTVIAQIQEVLDNTSSFKSAQQSRGEALADQLALPTLALSAVALPITGGMGALAVLYSYIGDSMRVVGPVSTLNYLRIASERNVLIKDGRALERLRKVDAVVFDKTGTLTEDELGVGELHVFGDISEEALLRLAAAAEARQSHPIARAILRAADERNLDLPAIEEASYQLGFGIMVELAGHRVRVGSGRFMAMEGIEVSRAAKETLDLSQESGHSLVMVAIDDEVVGAIELQPAIRPEAQEVVAFLRERGIATYIISGDHDVPTRRMANRLGIQRYFADVLPEDKARLVEELQQQGGVVCFIGDGVNDSIALKQADVSVSLQGASAIATDTAQILLMDQSLAQLPGLLDLAKELNLNQNTGFMVTVAPGVVTVSGVFLFHAGVIAAGALYMVGLAGGLGNSMLPLLRSRLTDAVPGEDDAIEDRLDGGATGAPGGEEAAMAKTVQ